MTTYYAQQLDYLNAPIKGVDFYDSFYGNAQKVNLTGTNIFELGTAGTNVPTFRCPAGTINWARSRAEWADSVKLAASANTSAAGVPVDRISEFATVKHTLEGATMPLVYNDILDIYSKMSSAAYLDFSKRHRLNRHIVHSGRSVRRVDIDLGVTARETGNFIDPILASSSVIAAATDFTYPKGKGLAAINEMSYSNEFTPDGGVALLDGVYSAKKYFQCSFEDMYKDSLWGFDMSIYLNGYSTIEFGLNTLDRAAYKRSLVAVTGTSNEADIRATGYKALEANAGDSLRITDFKLVLYFEMDEIAAAKAKAEDIEIDIPMILNKKIDANGLPNSTIAIEQTYASKVNAKLTKFWSCLEQVNAGTVAVTQSFNRCNFNNINGVKWKKVKISNGVKPLRVYDRYEEVYGDIMTMYKNTPNSLNTITALGNNGCLHGFFSTDRDRINDVDGNGKGKDLSRESFTLQVEYETSAIGEDVVTKYNMYLVSVISQRIKISGGEVFVVEARPVPQTATVPI